MLFTLKHSISLLILSLASPMLIGEEPIWKKVKTEKGVDVYRATLDGRISFRGVGLINGDSEKLISIIEDPKRWGNWIENFKSGKLIEKISPNQKIFYQALHSPFPASDRDVLYESKILRGHPKKIRIEMKSVKHPNAPKTVGVRINIISSRYLIEKKNPQLLKVTFDNLSEAGGAIPHFLVNWASSNYPVTLIQGLRQEMEK